MTVNCQQRVDAKAFTGKGAQRALRDLQARIEAVHCEMRELVQPTLAVPGKAMYLCLHRRSRTGQLVLRWRQCGATAPHMSWHEVDRLLSSYPPVLRHWYRDVDMAARRLNRAEKRARAALRELQLEISNCLALPP